MHTQNVEAARLLMMRDDHFSQMRQITSIIMMIIRLVTRRVPWERDGSRLGDGVRKREERKLTYIWKQWTKMETPVCLFVFAY